MKPLDRILQRWRIAKAATHIPRGVRLLDVGCGDGALFRQLGGRLRSGVGVDPMLPEPVSWGRFRLEPGRFPDGMVAQPAFDVVTLLAVLEHIPETELDSFVRQCAGCLCGGGRLIVTVPSPRVDGILCVLRGLGLVEGLRLEEHHGFEPLRTPELFTRAGLELVQHTTFQLGLNHLYVFTKPGDASRDRETRS